MEEKYYLGKLGVERVINKIKSLFTPKALYIHFELGQESLNGLGYTVTADKSYEKIVEALAAGKQVYGVLDGHTAELGASHYFVFNNILIGSRLGWIIIEFNETDLFAVKIEECVSVKLTKDSEESWSSDYSYSTLSAILDAGCNTTCWYNDSTNSVTLSLMSYNDNAIAYGAVSNGVEHKVLIKSDGAVEVTQIILASQNEFETLSSAVAYLATEDNEAVDEASGSANIDVTTEVGQTIIVEEVDANGKPTKWKSADYQPRTHWQGEKAMIPERTFKAGLIDGGPNLSIHGDTTLMGLTVGKTYIVVFDGVTYTCVAEAGVASLDGVTMYNVISIGNLGMSGGVDNGRPFFLSDIIDYDPPSWTCIPYEYGEHTLSVTGVDETNTIPEKYVDYRPALPYYIDVNCETSNNASTPNVYTCSETVENVRSVFASGREIKVRLTTSGANALLWIVCLNLFLHVVNEDIVLLAFSSPNVYGSNMDIICLESQNDGTFAVRDFIFDD